MNSAEKFLAVSNLQTKTIEYKKHDKSNNYHYEIYSQINNFENIIAYLFNISFKKLLQTLEEHNITIDINNTNHYGDIIINHEDQHIATLHINLGHAYFSSKNNTIEFELSDYIEQPHLLPYLLYNTDNKTIKPYEYYIYGIKNLYGIHNLFYINLSVDKFFDDMYHQQLHVTDNIIQFYTNYFIYILKTGNEDTINRYFRKCNINLLNISTIHKSDIKPELYNTFIVFHESNQKYIFETLTYNSNRPITTLFENTIFDFTQLTNLKFGQDFNQKLLKDVLPPNLTHLKFGYYFDKELSQGVLPPKITHLKFGYYFDQELSQGVLPPKITHLTFGLKFNQKLLQGVLPPLITHLTFGQMFDQKLLQGVLPPLITHLTFGEMFNQELSQGVLPPLITHLTFGYFFNQELLQGMLPPLITHLTFGYNFNKQLDIKNLPPNLIELTLPPNYKNEYKNKIKGFDKNSQIIKYIQIEDY